MLKVGITKKVMAAAFAVAGLTVFCQDAQAQNVLQNTDNNDKGRMILTKSENVQYMPLVEDVKFMDNNSLALGERGLVRGGSLTGAAAGVNNISSPSEGRLGGVLSRKGIPTGFAQEILSPGGRVEISDFGEGAISIAQGHTPAPEFVNSKEGMIMPLAGGHPLPQLYGSTNVSPTTTTSPLRRGGSLTGAAAPTPTLDSIKTDSVHYLDVEGGHKTYTLSTAEGSNTHSIYINGIKYWYTPNEEAKGGYTADQLNAMLVNLVNTGSAAMIDVGEGGNWVLKLGDTCYGYDTTKLPVSAYTITAYNTEPTSWNWTDGTKYYKLNFPGDKKRATNGVTLFDEQPAEATGKTKGSIDITLPNNDNRTVWYQYDTSRTENVERVNNTLNTANTNNKVFTGKSGSNGGAIYNAQNLPTKVINSDFIGNSVSSSSYGYGGAISNYSNGGTVSIGSVIGDFIGNSAPSGSYGGAISNNSNGGTVSIGSVIGDFIGNSATYNGGAISNYSNTSSCKAIIGSIVGDFIGNSSSSDFGAYGGAISNFSNGGTVSIGSIVGDFIGNSSSSSSAFGGAINNFAFSTASIGSIVGDFIGNSSSSSSSSSDGGAIYNFSTTLGTASIGSIDGNFIGNSSVSTGNNAFGGAISNTAVSDIARIGRIVGNFTGNYAKTTSTTNVAYGGAIFNGYQSSGTPQYRAGAQITLAGNTFTGNYVQVGLTQTPNSIYNAGVINIADGATVTINDGYDGLGEAQLNIGTGTNSGSIFNLSVDNGTIQTDNLGTVTNKGTINWDLDVDFSKSQKSDLITVNNSSTLGTKSVLIRSINLIADPTSVYEVNIASSGSPLYNALYIAGDSLLVHGAADWNVTYNSGNLIFAIANSLAKQVHADTPLARTYTMTAAETVGEYLGQLGGTGAKLDVNGGGFAINGGTYTGITVSEGQTLTFTNVSDVTGFADATAVTNGGSLEITDSKFTSKIANNASMTLKGTNTLNGAISGTNGQTVISTGTTTVGADLSQKDLTVESGAGLNIAANNLNITNAVKNDGTVTLTGGSADSYVTLGSSIGNKTESATTAKTVIDGFVNVNYNNSGDQKTISQAIEINPDKALRANVKSVGGAVTNNGNLAIYGYEDQADTTFNKTVTGTTGTTTITRKVNVNSSIENDIVLDSFVDEHSVTKYANVSVGENGTLGATGKTITIKAGSTDNTYNTLTTDAGKIATDTILNDGRLVLTGGTLGADVTKNASGGIIDINNSAADGTVTVSKNITNQTVNVNTGTLHLTTTATDGSNLSGSTVNVANSAILSTIDSVINDYSTTVLLADGAVVQADINNTSIDKYGAATGATSITLGAINAFDIGDIQAQEFQLVAGDVTVNADSLAIINTSGKSVSIVGSGTNNGKVLVSESTSEVKLNGAIYISPTKAYITYVMEDSETVNTDKPALGHIKDNFTIQSNNATQKTITATNGTKGIIVDNGHSLTLNNVKFANFASGELDDADDNYDGNYRAAITVASGATMTATNTSFTNNSGALYNEATGNMTLNNVSASNNTAANGGALYNAGTATINGGTYSGNSATSLGGAIYTNTNLTINSDSTNGAVSFSGNTHNTATTAAANDIYMAGGDSPITLNLKAADTTTNTISLGSGVAGTNYNVNVNDGTTGKVSIASLAGAGTIALKGGELDLTSDTSATSLNASDATTLNASSTNGLTVGTLTVADSGTFINSGKLSVTSTLNNGSTGATGTITNTNAVLNLLGGTSATAPMTNIGSISGGNINIGSYTSDIVKDTAYVVNSGSITGEVSVAKESTLQSAANTVTDTTGIANAGKLTLTGGNLASAVSGTGVTNVIGTVTNTDAKEIANALEITDTGHLTTATTTLASSTTTKNAGTLVFNNASDGVLRQSITDNGTHGTVEIDADGKTIDMNGQTITGNTIKLSSGTLKAGSTDGNVNLSGATKIAANGGTLSVQDGKTGTIQLGTVDTATNNKNLNVAIDADFMHGTTTNDRGIVGSADVINATSVTGSNKIHVSDIKLSWDPSATPPETNQHPIGTEFTAKIASGAASNAMDVSNTTTTISSYRSGVGNILLSYTVDSAYDGYLTGRHSTLDEAITSSVDNKMYFMDEIAGKDNDATITGPKTLNGNSLAITTNGNNISLDPSATAGSSGIIIGDASRTLSIKGTKGGTHSANTTISGFGTAIDNTAGGKVNLTDVTMEGNIKDIINDGEIDSSTAPATEKGVFLAGTNNINSIVDSDGSATHGQTTVKGGTSTIDTIKQKSVTVDADATANLTNVDNVKITDGITNDGDLVLAGGTAPANNDNKITMTADAGNAKTTIAAGSNITNTQTMTQKEVVVSAGDESTTPATPAAKLTNNSTINADTINVNDSAELNNNSNIAAADGSSTAAVNVKSNADLNLNKGSNTKADVTLDAATSDLTITDNGTLSGEVIADNSGSINLVADQDDITMSDAITGAIKGSVDPATGQPTDGSYIVTVTTSEPTGADKVVTIDKAIAGATEVDVNDDTNAVITDTAYTSTSPSTPATVKVGNNGELTLKNTTSDEKDVISAITGQDSDDKYDVTVANTNAGTTNINNTISGAKTVTGDGGTTNLNSTITGVDKIVANAGTTNINAGSNNNTSTQIGTADIDINSGATAGVKTTSDNFALTNDVTGADATSTLKLDGKSGTAGTASDPGTQFNIASDVNGGTVEIANGQLNLPNENKVANADGVKVDTGATLNTMNGAPTTYNTNTEFEDASQIKVDVNAISKASDRFANPQQAAGEGVVLTDLALQDLDKIVHRNTDIDLRNTTNLSNVTVGSELLGKKFQAMTPIRMMEATIDQNAMLNIHPSSDRNDYNSFNPAVVVAPIAAQMGGYLSQLNSYDEAFRNLDMKMLMTREERQALKMANRYASEVQPHIFSETYLPEKSSAGWFRPYASFEKVGLKNGPRVENVMYGSYFGGDSQMYETKNGWDYQYSVYIGYNGSHQNYQGNSIYQNGGNIGATGVWYKKDFFTALTANVGASVADASTMYGHEDFPMLMTGVASKTGYNWELAKGKFIIQPSYTMSYTFVNTFNYTNAAGVGINSDPLHAINIAPGLKFIGNLKNGWQPYAGVQMVWNIMDKTDFHANDIALPELSVKPYFQYGVGIQKRWGERFTGFGQAMLRNGGRNGIALSAGFRWAIGKAPSATSSKVSKAMTAKTKQTVLKQQTKRVIKSSSERKTKLSNFFGKMDGEQTYIVNVIK